MEEDPAFQDTIPQTRQGSSGSGSRPAGPWEPPPLEDMQAMLPQYEFVSVLGRGGMGVVYKARQISLDRTVAVKVLPGDLIDDMDVNFVERFKQEARTMARMNHPAIVGVFDFGETATGLLYFVMEFVDGTDVSRMIIGSGSLPAEHALAITAHVCDALGYAHSHGVVHRDIKPANILINMDGQVKVADFGLAKASDSKELGLTKSNVAMGTPDFVSPEALIPGIPLDGRADLYAVGVMLYQMLTGDIPRGMWSMPSAKVGADPRFDAIIAKAMQTDRESRYQTAHEVRTDLDRILTMPIVKEGGSGNVAVPKLVVRQQRPATGARPMTQGAHTSQHPLLDVSEEPVRKKSAAGLILGISAVSALAVGAFFMLPGQKSGETTAPISPNQTSEVDLSYKATPPPPSSLSSSVVEEKPQPPPSPGGGGGKPNGGLSERVFGAAGRSYRLVLEELPWDKAKAKAENMGGHLATISSRDEEEWMRRTFRPLLDGKDFVWVGAQRRGFDALWEWITDEEMIYANWSPGSLDNKGTPNRFLGLHLQQDRVTWEHLEGQRRAPFVIEWDNFGNTPRGAPRKEIVNLLDRIEISRDAVKGTWRKVPGGIKVDQSNGGTVLECNYALPEEYDFIVEFTPNGEGNNVNQYLSSHGKNFTWKNNLGGHSGKFGFDLLDGKTLDNRTEAVGHGEKDLKSGQRYRSEVQVRKDGLRALVDGNELVNWHGDFNRLSLEGYFPMRDSSHIGVGTFGRDVTFNRMELRVVTLGSSTPAKSGSLASTGPSTPASGMTRSGGNADKPGETPKDPRLAQLQAGFMARYEADAQKPYLAAVASLNQSYINSGISRARAAAQAAGNLREVSALDAEKELIEKGQGPPATDADGLPASLSQLRKTYRDAVARYTADRDAKAAPLYAIYVKALDDYVIELTKANRIEDAQKVRQFRDEIAQKNTQISEPVAPASPPPVLSTLTLFDGKSLDGWKIVGPPDAFTISRGAIKSSGGNARGNLYYFGAGAHAPKWKDFTLTMKVKTGDKANSGVWIHASGVQGPNPLEVQIANENGDPQKTGSLCGIKRVEKMPVRDDQWFDLRVVVKGMTITVFVNDKQINEWTQPPDWTAPGNARLGEGTIGVQSLTGEVWFKEIKVTPG